MTCATWRGVVLGVLGLAAGAGAAEYNVIGLGPAEGFRYSYAWAISDAGHVVGGFRVIDADRSHAFLYFNGTFQDIGTLFEPSSSAWGVNNVGQVVGVLTKVNDSPWSDRGFLYSDGVVQQLDTLGRNESLAYSINNAGQVVGAVGYPTTAILYSDGVMQELGTLGGVWSYAYAINDRGQIVGSSQTASGKARGFVYSNGRMREVGVMAEDYGAFDINNFGAVVGDYTTPNGDHHAFSYSYLVPELEMFPVFSDLGTLGGKRSSATAVNDAGQVVGYSYLADNITQHAFLGEVGRGRMIDLNTLLPPGSGWTLTWAEDINNLGQIVGRGFYQGREQAFLMTPTSIPEPAVVSLLSVALLGAHRPRRARRPCPPPGRRPRQQ